MINSKTNINEPNFKKNELAPAGIYMLKINN